MGRIQSFKYIFFVLLTSITLFNHPQYHRIFAEDTIPMSLSATVPAHEYDYQFHVTSNPNDSTQSQGTEILYTITYGSHLPRQTTPFILKATIEPGQIQGITQPTLYIADYVLGSASNAYNMTEPVINQLDHSISWTIPTLPAQTIDQTISFKLKLNTSYTGTQTVLYNVLVKAITPDITLNEVVQQRYQFKPPPPIPTPSPTPLPIIPRPNFTYIYQEGVTNTTTTFSWGTTTPTKSKMTATPVDSGETKVVSESSLTQNHRLTIQNLSPNTSYTIRLYMTDSTGQTAQSAAYFIHTNLEFTPLVIDTNTLRITSFDTTFSANTALTSKENLPIATIPTNTQYTIQLTIPDTTLIQNVQIITRDTHILGYSTDTPYEDASLTPIDTPTNQVDMIELSPSFFAGTLKTNPLNGIYELRVRITDIHNNIIEHYLGTISVVKPFTVIRSDTKEPIEHARIFLSRYSPKTGTYTPLSPTFFHIQNPRFTDYKGEASIILPYGTYKADVSYLEATETIFFKIDNSQYSGFPVVSLQPTPLTFFGTTRYHLQNMSDTLVAGIVSLGSSLGTSKRLFESITSLSLLLLVSMSLLAFSSRTLMSIVDIPRFVSHIVERTIWHTRKSQYLTGIVIDATTRLPISLVTISIIDISTNTIATSTKTNRAGLYMFRFDENGTYEVELRKPGYEISESVLFQPGFSPNHLIHTITSHPSPIRRYSSELIKAMQVIIGGFLEVFIALSLILELVFLRYFGIQATLPYISISLFTLWLWISYMHHRNHLSRTIAQE